MLNWALLIFVLFGNLWFWYVFNIDRYTGLILSLASFFFWLVINHPKKRYFIFLVISFFLLIVQQWEATEKSLLNFRDNDDIRIQTQRMREYPPLNFSFNGKTYWIPAAYWLEQKYDWTLALKRLEDNLFQNLDINQYFFAGHPLERWGYKEFEKFPFILLPFFLIGLFNLSCQKLINRNLLLFLIPLFIFTYTGNKNVYGPISFYPLFMVSIYQGVILLLKSVKNFRPRIKYLILLLLFFIGSLIFIQSIIYEFF